MKTCEYLATKPQVNHSPGRGNERWHVPLASGHVRCRKHCKAVVHHYLLSQERKVHVEDAQFVGRPDRQKGKVCTTGLHDLAHCYCYKNGLEYDCTCVSRLRTVRCHYVMLP